MKERSGEHHRGRTMKNREERGRWSNVEAIFLPYISHTFSFPPFSRIVICERCVKLYWRWTILFCVWRRAKPANKIWSPDRKTETKVFRKNVFRPVLKFIDPLKSAFCDERDFFVQDFFSLTCTSWLDFRKRKKNFWNTLLRWIFPSFTIFQIICSPLSKVQRKYFPFNGSIQSSTSRF